MLYGWTELYYKFLDNYTFYCEYDEVGFCTGLLERLECYFIN